MKAILSIGRTTFVLPDVKTAVTVMDALSGLSCVSREAQYAPGPGDYRKVEAWVSEASPAIELRLVDLGHVLTPEQWQGRVAEFRDRLAAEAAAKAEQTPATETTATPAAA